MNARETLENYGELREKAELKAREAALCKKQLARDTANESHLKIRLSRLTREQKSLQRRLLSRQKQIEYLLSLLEEEQLSRVLALRYLSLLSYEQIALSLHFSPRHIYRLHVKGVMALQKILEA